MSWNFFPQNTFGRPNNSPPPPRENKEFFVHEGGGGVNFSANSVMKNL